MEKESRKCKCCGQDFIPTRSDALFCGTNCRWDFCRSQNKKEHGTQEEGELLKPSLPLEKPALINSLQGVISDRNEQALAHLKVNNTVSPEYLTEKARLDQLMEIKTRVHEEIDTCVKRMQCLNADFLFYVLGGGHGYLFSQVQGNGLGKNLLWGCARAALGGIIKNMTQDFRKEEIKRLEGRLKFLQSDLQKGEEIIKTQQEKVISFLDLPNTSPHPDKDDNPSSELTLINAPVLSNERIISSEDLINTEFQALNFRTVAGLLRLSLREFSLCDSWYVRRRKIHFCHSVC